MKSTVGFVCSLLLFLTVMYGAVAHQLRQTVFSTDFSAAQIERADPVRIVKSMLIERLDPAAGAALTPVIDKTLADQRAWLTSEIRQAATSIQDFLRGDAARIQVHVDPEPVRKVFMANIETTLSANPRPWNPSAGETERLAVQETARQAANTVFDEIGSFTFDSERLSAARQSQLLQLRSRLALFRRPLILVICVVVALGFLAGVVGQLRQAAAALLAAAIALFLGGFFASRLVTLLPLPSLDSVPGAVANYLPTFIDALVQPLRPVAMACLVVAMGLLVLSFVLPTATPRPAPRRL